MSKPNVRFKSWSASRLDDYNQCPRKAMHKHLLKTCPICFKGALKGGYDTPAVCGSCHGTPEKGPALVRGGEIGDTLDLYLTGQAKTPGATILHPAVKAIVKTAKAEVKKGVGAVQISIKFNRNWKVIPGEGWSPDAWVFVKLDYRRVIGAMAHVTDWKTGGCEKKGKEIGKVKVVDKYDDQLDLYNVATLTSLPEVEGVTSDLVFLDCAPPHNPVVTRNDLARKDLKKAQDRLTKKALPMLSDDTFAPKASYACSWCDYSKGKGGPCPF